MGEDREGASCEASPQKENVPCGGLGHVDPIPPSGSGGSDDSGLMLPGSSEESWNLRHDGGRQNRDALQPLSIRELHGLIEDDPRCLALLVTQGRLDARDAKGDTPLHIVARLGRLRSADLLVREGADTAALNLAARTPAQVAAASGHHVLAQLLTEAAAAPCEPPPAAVPSGAVAVDQPIEALDDLLDALDFGGEPDAALLGGGRRVDAPRGAFEPIGPEVAVRGVDGDATVEWDIGQLRVEIDGEGFNGPASLTVTAPKDESIPARRGLRRPARPAKWRSFRIDEAGCEMTIARVMDAGCYTDDDLDELVAFCHGRFDALDLRANITAEIAASGLPYAGDQHDPWEPPTDVDVDDLVEAVIATCTRAAILPGHSAPVPLKEDLPRLTSALVEARQTTLMGLVQSPLAVGIILYMADRIVGGQVDPAAVTSLDFDPAVPSRDRACFDEAITVLRCERDRIAEGSRRAVRLATAAAERLDFKVEFLRNVAIAMRDAPELLDTAERLDADLDALEGTTLRILDRFLPLCRRFAAQQAADGEDQEDVFQAAFLGLRRAALRFDPELSGNFHAYAGIWMKQSLSRWRADEGRIIRLPVHLQGLLRQALAATEALERRLAREPASHEITDELRLPPSARKRFEGLPTEPVALDGLEEPEDPDWVDGLPASLVEAQMHALLHEELDQLSGRQADIIRKRYGIGGADEMTLEQIGRAEGVTRERIRQIEAKALHILQHPARIRFLKAGR